MKVLVIHTTYKLRGGEDSVVHNEMSLLKSAGHHVELLQFSNQSDTLKNVLRLPFNYKSYLATLEKIRDFGPDVVHVHNLHFAASPSILYAVKRSKLPLVLTLHNYRLLCPSATLFKDGEIFMASVNSVFSWEAIFKKVYVNSIILTFWVFFSLLIHKILGTWELANKYIALGEYTKAIFSDSKLKSLVPKMIVKPNFCNQNPQSDLPKTYYLFLGRLSEEKGIKVLLKSFSLNGLPLKIAGTGPLELEVKNYSAQCNNIDYLGSVEREQAFELLRNAKALVFPSVWYETFGMVIIEAFSSGTPVIASRIGQLEFTIEHQINGLHFNAGDADDLAEKVNSFEKLSDEIREQYRKNAISTYHRKYAPEQNLKKLIGIYQAAIAANEFTPEPSTNNSVYKLPVNKLK